MTSLHGQRNLTSRILLASALSYIWSCPVRPEETVDTLLDTKFLPIIKKLEEVNMDMTSSRKMLSYLNARISDKIYPPLPVKTAEDMLGCTVRRAAEHQVTTETKHLIKTLTNEYCKINGQDAI